MNSNKALVCFLLVFILLFITQAQASVGFLSLDDESYYLHSDSRPDNTLALIFGPDIKTTTPRFVSEVELEGYMYVNHPGSFTPESQNLFIATNPALIPHHQFTFGRRIYDWSVADDYWRLGTWTQRFNWDPLNPEPVGNTGLFYTYDASPFRVLAFASYLNVPERGVPLNSNLTSPSGDWVSPFSQVNLPALNNANIPIQYTVDYPPTSQLIFQPSAQLQLKYDPGEGFWAQAEYGYMPIHQAIELIEGVLPAQALNLDVTVHPIVLMQHMATAEMGIHEKNWSLWASATREIPILPTNEPSNWIEQAMGPANIFSGGGTWETFHNFSIGASILYINENLTSNVPGNLSVNLPSRFPYHEASQFRINWQPGEKWGFQALWIDDISEASQIYTFDTSYRPSAGSRWFVGVGTDVIASQTNQGLIGQFSGNDRVRLRLNYAL